MVQTIRNWIEFRYRPLKRPICWFSDHEWSLYPIHYKDALTEEFIMCDRCEAIREYR